MELTTKQRRIQRALPFHLPWRLLQMHVWQLGCTEKCRSGTPKLKLFFLKIRYVMFLDITVGPKIASTCHLKHFERISFFQILEFEFQSSVVGLPVLIHDSPHFVGSAAVPIFRSKPSDFSVVLACSSKHP